MLIHVISIVNSIVNSIVDPFPYPQPPYHPNDGLIFPFFLNNNGSLGSLVGIMIFYRCGGEGQKTHGHKERLEHGGGMIALTGRRHCIVLRESSNNKL